MKKMFYNNERSRSLKYVLSHSSKSDVGLHVLNHSIFKSLENFASNVESLWQENQKE
jgi:hypothetical protein